MKLIIGTCKCTKCGEVFKATNECFSKCPNNCCEVKMTDYGFNYMGISSKDNYCEVLETEDFFPEEDYIQIDDRCKDILSWFESIQGYSFVGENKVEYADVFKRYDCCTNGEKRLRHIDIMLKSGEPMYNTECNYFRSSISCCKSTGNGIDVIYSKLERMQSLYKDISNGSVNASVSNRDNLIQLFDDWDKEQKESYDYTFNI